MNFVEGPSIEDWRAAGRVVESTDGKIFTWRVGAEANVPILALHGFPTSSWDFRVSGAQIARDRPLVGFDFLGYGLSDKPARYSYSLLEQADVAIAVARAYRVEKVHIWAHDVGTSVATELLARRERGSLPFEIASVVLMNGSIHQELAHITTSQKLLLSPLAPVFARLSNVHTFKAQMRRIVGRPIDDKELNCMWALVERESGLHRLPQLAGYMKERRRFERRWIGALERLDIPTLIAWGRKDPIAVLPIPEKLLSEIPNAQSCWWPDLGHYPQVEDPETVATSLAAFWNGLG